MDKSGAKDAARRRERIARPVARASRHGPMHLRKSGHKMRQQRMSLHAMRQDGKRSIAIAMRRELYVIYGPAGSGKGALARVLIEKRPYLLLLHPDAIATALVRPIKQPTMNLLLANMGGMLLANGHSVVTIVQIEQQKSTELWDNVAKRFKMHRYQWLNARDENIAQFLPALDDPRLEQWGIRA
jgi:hypothetical protein